MVDTISAVAITATAEVETPTAALNLAVDILSYVVNTLTATVDTLTTEGVTGKVLMDNLTYLTVVVVCPLDTHTAGVDSVRSPPLHRYRRWTPPMEVSTPVCLSGTSLR